MDYAEAQYDEPTIKAAVTEREPGPLLAACSDIHEDISRLDHMLERLFTKLEPVLGPGATERRMNPVDDTRGGSVAVNSLGEIRERVNNLITRIQEQTDRLET